MSVFHTPRTFIAAAAILIGMTAAALADPPARVGRLSDVEGTVSFHTADQTEWSPATLNYPVTGGTSLWTEPNGRSEIQIGGAEVRMDQSTALDVTQLDDDATQLQVNQGAINVHLSTLPPGGVSVITPMGQVDLLQPGSYDINAGQPNGQEPPTQILMTVLDGNARFDGPTGAVELQAGEAAAIGGNPINVTLAEGSATPFDDWALSREHREAAPRAAQYVPPDMTGYQDLDANGQWASTPDYGPVWYPNAVAADWAPYRDGHWAYVEPWGWTWIDDAPWGFAPFHYGRWAMVGGRWGWCPTVPGAFVERPVYAPALVAFVGGDGFGVSLSIGGPEAAVGWVPLAPFEPYHPWYHASRTYVRNVNIVNVRNTEINNITVREDHGRTVERFANRNAAVVVPARAFTHAAPVQRSAVAVPRDQLAKVQVASRMSNFHATADARAGFAHPNAAAGIKPGAQAAVARSPVPYHEQEESNRGNQQQAAQPRAPGPPIQRNAAQSHAPGPQMRQNAAVTSQQPRPQPGPHAAAPGPHPAAVAPPANERPLAQHPQAAPGPHPPAAANPAERPEAAAPARPAPHQAPPTATPAQPVAHAPAPRPAPQQAAPPRQVMHAPPAAPRPQMQVQHPVQNMHLAPTPQGWQRQAAPAAAPHQQAGPHATAPEEKKKQQE